MKKKYQELIDQYTECEKSLERSRFKTIVLEILMIGIVVYMKSIQEAASLKANAVATFFVTVLLCRHFWDFYPRKSVIKKMVDVVLEGVNLECNSSFLQPQFFKNYLKKFNTLGFIANIAIFDILLIYFFSVSYTQLLKSLSAETVIKLKHVTPFSTCIITLSIGLTYYKVVHSLSWLKRKVEV